MSKDGVEGSLGRMGVFVTFEGIEGSGKSTLLSSLAGVLRQRGRDVVTTREPGGTPVGTAVREIFLNGTAEIAPVAEAFLVNAARAQHVADVIRPALHRGAMVLCDRFTDSTLAYQGYGRGFDLAVLGRLCEIASAGLQPDLTILIDLPVPESLRRLKSRGGRTDRLEAEGSAFHERVRAGYLKIAAGDPRYLVLDGLLFPADLVAASLARLATSAS
ncbi:MAG: dTMP kinase [Vulcanimicrobiaceae bacterium]